MMATRAANPCPAMGVTSPCAWTTNRRSRRDPEHPPDHTTRGGSALPIRATSRLLVRWILLELALQAAAMNAEPARSFGDIPASIGEHAVDVLPLGARQRRRLVVVVGRRLERGRLAARKC